MPDILSSFNRHFREMQESLSQKVPIYQAEKPLPMQIDISLEKVLSLYIHLLIHECMECDCVCLAHFTPIL